MNKAPTALQPNSSKASPADQRGADQHGSDQRASDQRGNAADRRNDDRNDPDLFNQAYVNPWWPYGYDWGYGDYGTGTSAQPSNTNNSNTDNGTTPAAPPAVAAPPQSTPSAAASAAILANAVNKSPEMVAANNAVQLAQVAYDGERERVLAELAKTPAYQEALARKHDAVKDLQTAKDVNKGQPAVIDAATAKLDASDEVTKMREQAVATDANAAAAKSKLVDAVAERDAVRAKLTAQMAQH